ncbi:hypothetical protein B0A48_07652 [Cryoendolithus antarcticus]|uniref:AB hydrolase-1 domain-containing protein n=1 Tax=Cryoendolithus antarcticus TaxID=1507870 RepID=A0A1V8T6P7_9PEZI|nr:hypothetical protein B0A48_07652 [Cryoendolithus antarcticus]
MLIPHENKWESDTVADLVDIGTHKLFISTSGPPRRRGEPVVLFFTGAGAPVATVCRLQRLLSEHFRVYFYDRGGYDRSERNPNGSLDAQNGAIDLQRLLGIIGVAPPYVLMSYSYGGIAARAFMELYRDTPDAIVGLVLADCGTELAYKMYPKIPPAALDAVGKDVDLGELTHLREASQLTEDEWNTAMEAVERTAKQIGKGEEIHRSAAVLARSQQCSRHALDPWPVSVIRCNMAKDFRMIFDEGVERGQGTVQERMDAVDFLEMFRTYDDDVRSIQLRLSSCNRYVVFEDAGHDDLFRHPEKYVDEVRWVMAEMRKLAKR